MANSCNKRKGTHTHEQATSVLYLASYFFVFLLGLLSWRPVLASYTFMIFVGLSLSLC